MDESLLQWINQGWAHPWFDVFFGWVSHKQAFSFPLLIAILLLLIKNLGLSGWRLWLLLLVSVGLGDMLGNFLKHLIAQPRPCAEFPDAVRLVMEPFKMGCSLAPRGMPSNHALNFFLTASFLGVALRSWKWGISLGVIAGIVAISRVYLGVHYPSQVFVGAVLGGILGGLSGFAALHLTPLVKWLRLTVRKDPSGFYARFFYSVVLYLSVPFVLLKLLWRGRLNHDYWYRWPERFAWFGAPSLNRPVWIHAVSVGEVQAALPLVRELLARYPDRSIVVTTTTPTGSGRVRDELGDSVFHVYMPYDLPGAVERFLDRVKPELVLVMETELWPNLFYQCGQRGVPLVVANARLSQRSMEAYHRISSLTSATLKQVDLIAAQNTVGAERFEKLGMPADKIRVTGSIKFDLEISDTVVEAGQKLRQQLGAQRPVWIAASTHEGEDEKILQAFATVRDEVPDSLLVLVPRHPERFSSVVSLCEKSGLNVIRRTEDKPCDSNIQIFVGDTLGELLIFYAAADVAFVGGSLVPTGGHNVLEPAALGLPVVTGSHLFNFAEIAKAMREAGVLQQVENSEQLATVVADLLTHPETRHSVGEKGKELVKENRGSLNKLLEMIGPYIAANHM